MNGVTADAVRVWRRNELEQLRIAVARTSVELRRLDGEVEKLAAALEADAAPAAIAVLDSLRCRRAEAAAEIDRLMRAAAETFAALAGDADAGDEPAEAAAASA